MTIDLKDDQKYLVVTDVKDEIEIYGFYQKSHAEAYRKTRVNAQLIEL